MPSQHFEKVKRKFIQELKETQNHSQMSWCHTMLRAAERCQSDDDQKDFFRFILNPDDSFDVQDPVFMEIDSTKDVLIDGVQQISVKECDDEKERDTVVCMANEVHTNGKTTYIKSSPITS